MGAGTLAGVTVVRRVPPGSVSTVVLTSVVLVLFGVGDVLPQAYSAARGAGLAPWHVAFAVGMGALLAFCSGATCCGCVGMLPSSTGLMILASHRFLEGSAT